MIKTFIGYSKEGKKIQCYMLNHYNFNKLKKYMTLEEYESIEYIQEYKWDPKTTHNEDGSFNKNSEEWKIAENTIKHYIHK